MKVSATDAMLSSFVRHTRRQPCRPSMMSVVMSATRPGEGSLRRTQHRPVGGFDRARFRATQPWQTQLSPAPSYFSGMVAPSNPISPFRGKFTYPASRSRRPRGRAAPIGPAYTQTQRRGPGVRDPKVAGRAASDHPTDPAWLVASVVIDPVGVTMSIFAGRECGRSLMPVEAMQRRATARPGHRHEVTGR
jgi:hypothetical protein